MRSRRGFTLVEMLMAMTLTMVIFSAAIPFFRAQVRALGNDAARVEARQGARFAVAALDRELRVAGLGLAEGQPALVAAHPRSVTFNADLVTNDATDIAAAFYDPAGTKEATTILTRERGIALPLVGGVYPEVTYSAQGGGRAETISYWAENDLQDPRPDRFVLWRRINDGTPTVVVRNLILALGEPLFHYFKTDSANMLVEVDVSGEALMHTEPRHDSPADTGRSALIDSLRLIRSHLAIAQAVVTARGDSVHRIEHSTRLGNALQAGGSATCGAAPGMTILGAAAGPQAGQVTLTWTPSLDETAGERDVERYLIYRRNATAGAFGSALASIPAGASTYGFVDRNLKSGDSFVYGVLAQDCAGTNSALSLAAAIVP